MIKDISYNSIDDMITNSRLDSRAAVSLCVRMKFFLKTEGKNV